MLNPAEDAHLKSMSTFKADEHLQLDAQLLKIRLHCHQCAVIQHPADRGFRFATLGKKRQRCKRSPSDGLGRIEDAIKKGVALPAIY
jgi:hypothetical protein